MDLLSNKEVVDVISWLPHGESFIIYDREKFVSDILPVFFKESKFPSFARKLNRWGFERINRGVETGSFKHKYFKRDNRELCKKMKCQKKYERKKKSISYNEEASSSAPNSRDSKDVVNVTNQEPIPMITQQPTQEVIPCTKASQTIQKIDLTQPPPPMEIETHMKEDVANEMKGAIPISSQTSTTSINSSSDNPVPTAPTIDDLARNQINLNHLSKVKEQQDEINQLLQGIINSASELPRICNVNVEELIALQQKSA